jgi:ribosome-associated protein
VVAAATAADDKQANDVLVLDVGDVLSITGWFVICDGANARQVRTIADAVEEHVVEVGGPKPLRVEGRDGLHWVLLDYGDFVVHVFDDETRRFYDLERLWSDVPRIPWRS